MRILITGGAGYIGTTLAPMLLDLGHTVTVVDNFMYRQTPLLELCHNKRFNVHRLDVRNTNELVKLSKDADVILPLACLTGAPICAEDPVSAKLVNSDAVEALYRAKSKDQLLIFPCTNSGYGIGQEGLFCDENTPLNPISVYGKLKVETEKKLLDGGECVTFRFATVFGMSPRMRLDLLVNDFTYRAVTDKVVVLFESHFKRNFLHVRDAARAFLHAINHYDQLKGKPHNVGLSDANLSKKELCEAIQRVIPSFKFIESAIGEDQDKRNYIVSNKRIEATGYRTEHDLIQGIQELVKGFQILRRREYANFG